MQVGFTGLLTLLFITLKLFDVITWSWLWVLSPLWIGLIIMVLIWGAMFFFIMKATGNQSSRFRRRR